MSGVFGRAFIDLTGQEYGRLIPRERVPSPDRHMAQSSRDGAWWLCDCTCGGTKIVSSGNLRSGGVRSCGCLRRDNIRKVGKLNAHRRLDALQPLSV